MNHHKYFLSFVASALMAACSSQKTETREARSGSISTNSLELSVTNVSCEGELCPPGSTTTASLGGDGFQLFFSEAVFVGDGQSPITRAAEVTIDFQVPAGYQFGSGHFDLGVSVSKEQPSTHVVIDRRYAFEGSTESRSFSTELSNESSVLDDVTSNFWSASCDSDGPVRLKVRLSVTLDGPDFFALDRLNGTFGRIDGIEWRRCGEIDPIPRPPSGLNDYCGGFSRLDCEPQLACEFDEVNQLGTCIDPTEVVPPRERDQRCGGFRAISCLDGLVCHYLRASSPAENRTGYCTPTPGNEGDVCGGHPDVPCADGLTCFLDAASQTCVRPTGEFKSRCGEGLIPCNEGLVCNGSYCRYPAAHEGEECGGPREIVCSADPSQPRLTCVDGICRRAS